MRIVSTKYVPIPYARKLLENAVKPDEMHHEIVYTTLDYLRKFSKCGPEQALEAVERLQKEFGLSEFAAVMIVNILPKTVYELRAILAAAKVGGELTDEQLEKIIEVLNEVCGVTG